MKILLKLLAMVVITTITKSAVCQLKQDSLLDAAIAKPVAYVKDVEQRMQKVQKDFESKLNKKKAKILKEEQRIYGLFSKVDSSLGEFGNKLIRKIVPLKGQTYLPLFDSLTTSFNLMKKLNLAENEQVESSLNVLRGVEKNFEQAQFFHDQMNSRIQMLKEKLLKVGKINELKNLQEMVYYYKQQLNEYKSMLDKPDVIISKTLQVFQRSKVFKDFFARNSQLGQMFMIPGSSGWEEFSGNSNLQTINATSKLLKEKVGIDTKTFLSQKQNGANSSESVMNDLSIITQLKQKEDSALFAFIKPNRMRDQALIKRIEFGVNAQTKRSGYFPATIDFAATASYKLSDRKSFGLGLSYKLGLGTLFKDVEISHQGLGLRSFVDMKWKAGLSVTGGYELNYLTEIKSIAGLKELSAWQQSGLVGISRRFKASGKLDGNVQLLWDFLSYRQIPRSQPFVFRFGYTFKK
jgi:hypothetical protein